MLPELILREEEKSKKFLLVLLGLASAFVGFAIARVLFPSETDLLAVIFASIPLIYPLTSFFLEREGESAPHIPEVEMYGALFLGEVVAFFVLGFFNPEHFGLQLEVVGASGYATNTVSLPALLVNNLLVFAGILGAALIVGSAGAFVLTWNASVLGVFLAAVFQDSPVKVLGYLPHATLEMTGFIIAGISGSMISAAVYREHFDRRTWGSLGKLVVSGALLILLGALLETA